MDSTSVRISADGKSPNGRRAARSRRRADRKVRVFCCSKHLFRRRCDLNCMRCDRFSTRGLCGLRAARRMQISETPPAGSGGTYRERRSLKRLPGIPYCFCSMNQLEACSARVPALTLVWPCPFRTRTCARTHTPAGRPLACARERANKAESCRGNSA